MVGARRASYAGGAYSLHLCPIRRIVAYFSRVSGAADGDERMDRMLSYVDCIANLAALALVMQ